MDINRRFVAILSVLAIAATACGGGSADSATTRVPAAESSTAAPATASLSLDERTRALTDILLAAMSDGAATEALLFAVDAGYSADQIDAGIRNGGLDEDGVITQAGEAIMPASPAAGRILDDRATGSSAGQPSLQLEPVVFLKQQPDLLPIGDLRRQAGEIGVTLGEAGAFIVLGLISRGFDQEAIVETLLFGGQMVDDHLTYQVDGRQREVNCPYTRTPESPEPIFVSPFCWYTSDDDTTVAVDRTDLRVPSGSSQTDPVETDAGSQESDAPRAALRTWQGRFTDTAGGGAWSTVHTTLVEVEEQADGSLVMRRQTDSVYVADPAIYANPCLYVYFDTGMSTSAATRPLDSLRFEGTRQGVYEEGDCADEGGPAAGSFTELVTGSLDGDVLTLNGAFDGVGPVVLDPPTTR